MFLSLNYSGGLGVTSGMSGYYLANSYGAGISYPFQWEGAWFAAVLSSVSDTSTSPVVIPGNCLLGKVFSIIGSLAGW